MLAALLEDGLRSDKDVVQAFAAHPSEEPFADRVTVRRGRRDSDDGRSVADGDSIKDATELTVIISDEEPRAVANGIASRSCWAVDWSVGFRVTLQ